MAQSPPTAFPDGARILASADMDGDGQLEVAATFQRLYPARIIQEEDDVNIDLGQWAADGERVRGIYTPDGAGGWRALWEQTDPAWQPVALPRVQAARDLADWAPMMDLQFVDLRGDGHHQVLVTRTWRSGRLAAPSTDVVVLAYERRATRVLLSLHALPNGRARLVERELVVEESEVEASICQCITARRFFTVYRLVDGGLQIADHGMLSAGDRYAGVSTRAD